MQGGLADIGFNIASAWRTSSREVESLIPRVDWSATLLGPKEHWSPSLQATVRIILASAFPMALRWGVVPGQYVLIAVTEPFTLDALAAKLRLVLET